MNYKELPPAGDIESLQHSLERLSENDLVAIVRDADVTRVLAARALLERELDFDELLILARDVPAIRNDFWKKIKSRATDEQFVQIMRNLPDLEERAARMLLERRPNTKILHEMSDFLSTHQRIGAVRARVNQLLQHL